ncbi:hypothetical protein [Falsiroseomonas sp. HW251]|uniref:hypothetical protein n=1 Tax=Falsiroseomonas sp. HW251 TaxID=3390998 RepID=UPI003D30FAFB
MAAFYLKGVAPPHVKLEDIFKGCMPFIYIVIFCMLMVYIFPGLVTWLPEQLYGGAPVDPATAGSFDAAPPGGFMEQEEIALPPLN